MRRQQAPTLATLLAPSFLHLTRQPCWTLLQTMSESLYLTLQPLGAHLFRLQLRRLGPHSAFYMAQSPSQLASLLLAMILCTVMCNIDMSLSSTCVMLQYDSDYPTAADNLDVMYFLNQATAGGKPAVCAFAVHNGAAILAVQPPYTLPRCLTCHVSPAIYIVLSCAKAVYCFPAEWKCCCCLWPLPSCGHC